MYHFIFLVQIYFRFVHAFFLTTAKLVPLRLVLSLNNNKLIKNTTIQTKQKHVQIIHTILTSNTKTNKGSLFELTGGTPKLGFGVTAAISAIGLPLSVFLIYAAILKGAAETEEADREFNKPRRL
jgi:hypothetical protein